MQGTDATLASFFVASLFGATSGAVYISSLPNTAEDRDCGEPGEKHVMTRDGASVVRFVERWDRAARGLFFCVSTLRDGATRRSKEDVREIAILHADIDFKSIVDGEAEALAALEVLPSKPSIVVRSGNGLHLYWLLKEAVELDAEGIARVEMCLRQLSDVVGGDIGVTEVSRLMRLPGTHNTKGGAWTPVSILRADYEARHLLEDIEEMLSYVSPLVRRRVSETPRALSPTNPFAAAATRLGFKPPVDVQARLEAMSYQGAGDASIHQTQISVSAALLNRGVGIVEVVASVLDATRAAAGEHGERWNWVREERAVRRMCEEWLRKNPQARERVEYVEEKAQAAGGGANVTDLAGFRKQKARSGRPAIRLEADNIEDVVDQAEDALIDSGRGLYQRGNAIVSVGPIKVVTANEKEVIAQRIFERGDHALLEDLTCAARFERYDGRKREFKVVEPPMKVVHVLKDRTGRLRFPILTAVINCPTLREDGSLLDKPGYDEATGLLLDPGDTTFGSVPDRPTRADAESALRRLEVLISTFPFVADTDRSVALAALLTAPVRRSLRTAPLFGFSATVAGSGKSMLVDIVSVIATGHEAGVIAQGKSEEESEKRLGAILRAGDGVLALDNCELPVGGDLLCQMLTQPNVRIRILGRSETVEAPTSCLVTATGNNLTLIGDMTRRAVLCRLDAHVERPEERTFAVDPIALAKAERGELVASALIVLRAYIAAGKPPQVNPLGSFVEWSNLVRSALLWLGRADPVATMDEVRKNDPKLVALQSAMSQWKKVLGLERTSAGDAARTAMARSSPVGSEAQGALVNIGLFEALQPIAGSGGGISADRLGRWLGKNVDRILTLAGDDAQFSFQRDGILEGVVMWRLTKVGALPCF